MARRNISHLTEAQIARQICDFLALDNWRPIKMEPISRREWGKGTGEVGQADYLFIRYSRPPEYANAERPEFYRLAEVVWIEFKKPGGKPSAQQLDWHQAERARGALTLIAGVDFAADFDGFVVWYRQSGLLRRKGL